MSDDAQEIEAALMVCADAPAQIAAALSRMDTIAGYKLGAEHTVPIRDVLFDTADRKLGTRGYVFRVRKVPGKDLLTLKGESRAADWGGVQRLEIEGEAIPETIGRIDGALRRVGIQLSFGAAPPGDGIKLLRAAGLHPIQERETLRRARQVQDGSVEFAELAIDRVSTRIGTRTAAFYQIEVESKGAGKAAALQAVVSDLESRFEGTLVTWGYGKMATLFALMRAARVDGLDVLVDGDGMLTAHGCSRLRAILESGRQVSP